MNKALQKDDETKDSQREGLQKNQAESQEEKSKSASFSFFLYRLIAYADTHRSVASFVIILLLVWFSDLLFINFLFLPYAKLVESLSGVLP